MPVDQESLNYSTGGCGKSTSTLPGGGGEWGPVGEGAGVCAPKILKVEGNFNSLYFAKCLGSHFYVSLWRYLVKEYLKNSINTFLSFEFIIGFILLVFINRC